jgi:hypothetical protein
MLDKSVNGIDSTWRPRLRWEDNIKIELKRVGWQNANWIHPELGPTQPFPNIMLIINHKRVRIS